MTIDEAIYLWDALEMQARGMSKAVYVGCVKASAKDRNAQAYDDALALTARMGTRRKALNYVARELEAARCEFFPA